MHACMKMEVGPGSDFVRALEHLLTEQSIASAIARTTGATFIPRTQLSLMRTTGDRKTSNEWRALTATAWGCNMGRVREMHSIREPRSCHARADEDFPARSVAQQRAEQKGPNGLASLQRPQARAEQSRAAGDGRRFQLCGNMDPTLVLGEVRLLQRVMASSLYTGQA